MNLITGAAGKTGQAVLKALAADGQKVRVYVRNNAHSTGLQALGAAEIQVGDLMDDQGLRKAFRDVRAVYHICPNMNPQEVQLGQKVILAAQEAGIEHLVYHSVLHPQVQEMAHHWNKLQVEALLFRSGLNFTILQPASYMQNIAGYWRKMQTEGIYSVPYSTAVRFSMLDLDDLGQVAARVIMEGAQHYRATYELCGAQLLSSSDMADLAGAVLQRPVRAVELERSVWDATARANGMDDYTRQTLLAMFEYYDHHGFAGNAMVLTSLLGRQPGTFENFLQRFSQHI